MKHLSIREKIFLIIDFRVFSTGYKLVVLRKGKSELEMFSYSVQGYLTVELTKTAESEIIESLTLRTPQLMPKSDWP